MRFFKAYIVFHQLVKFHGLKAVDIHPRIEDVVCVFQKILVFPLTRLIVDIRLSTDENAVWVCAAPTHSLPPPDFVELCKNAQKTRLRKAVSGKVDYEIVFIPFSARQARFLPRSAFRPPLDEILPRYRAFDRFD